MDFYCSLFQYALPYKKLYLRLITELSWKDAYIPGCFTKGHTVKMASIASPDIGL